MCIYRIVPIVPNQIILMLAWLGVVVLNRVIFNVWSVDLQVQSEMEELATRFPHLCENVLKSLDDGNIATFRKVGRFWGKYLDKQKFVKIRIIKATVE